MNDRNRLRTLGPSPASLPPLSFFFFFSFLFIPTLARVVYLALSRRRATSCCAVCTQKAQFHPVSSLPIALFLHLHLLPPPVSL